MSCGDESKSPKRNHIFAISDRGCPATAPYSRELRRFKRCHPTSSYKLLHTWGHEGGGRVTTIGSRTCRR